MEYRVWDTHTHTHTPGQDVRYTEEVSDFLWGIGVYNLRMTGMG